MNLSDKLDFLQEMAAGYAGDSNRMYVIGLLAEHAEEAEVTGEMLGWVREKLMGVDVQ